MLRPTLFVLLGFVSMVARSQHIATFSVDLGQLPNGVKFVKA